MYLHVMGDALGSAFVVANACIIKYGTQWGDMRLLADPITSLIMVFIIMIQTGNWTDPGRAVCVRTRTHKRTHTNTYTCLRVDSIKALIMVFIIIQAGDLHERAEACLHTHAHAHAHCHTRAHTCAHAHTHATREQTGVGAPRAMAWRAMKKQL